MYINIIIYRIYTLYSVYYTWLHRTFSPVIHPHNGDVFVLVVNRFISNGPVVLEGPFLLLHQNRESDP